MRRAELLLATGAMQAQNDDEVGARCRAVLARDLDWSPPPRDFAPPVRERFEKEKQQALEKTATVKVTAPDGTRLFVAGLERGSGQVEVKVPVGRVTIQGYEDGVLGAERVLDVPQQGIAADLAPYCGKAAHLGMARCAAALRALAGEARIVRLRSSQALALHEGSASRRTTLPVRLESRWLAQLADWFLGKRPSPPELVDPMAKVTPLYKRWWVWTLVGVALAGTVTAIVVAPRGGSTFDPQVAITSLRAR